MAGDGWLTQRPPTGLLVAQAVGITASTYLFGENMSLSFISVPPILQAPAPLAARQWHQLYDIAKSFALPLTAIATLSSAYVTHHHDPASLPFKLNLAATLIFPAIVPYTLLVIGPINDKLFAKEKEYSSKSLEDKAVEAGVGKEETVHALIDRWALVNVVRAGITGVGAVLTVWAALDRRVVRGFGGGVERLG
ncbi:hypothetical protein P280DRAFT_458251 [Massarina eburnea CBS 473.64]|uniref:DUF1772-domain-containing protein n=1 Tax=Massarina eburnea CBS 473.64 TaxID=1395130 RepID=A0A6A6RPN4_9PLEO|nr:hypothetical protein P280DRAFT_458251 [Massarina eburnea CBS 473.64]